MKQIAAPKGWAQLLLTPPATPWAALRSVLAAGPAATTQTLIDAGLRGRGGGGFLTGEKWRITATSDADVKYAVANGYESDPAVFTNRLLLEKNAQAVVEGLAAAALAQQGPGQQHHPGRHQVEQQYSAQTVYHATALVMTRVSGHQDILPSILGLREVEWVILNHFRGLATCK